ncbi:MAG: hypothetical protein MJ238_02685 [Bacilli bacterium]|nr:hypothetical protein [Bacilli bacterium]
MKNRALSEVQKVVLAAMFLALAIAMTYVAKLIQPAGGYLRFSLTPGIVVFSSLLLGPFYGAIVGAGSDLLNAIIIPQGAINYLLTIVYGLLGVAPWALKMLVARWEWTKKPVVIWATFAVIFVGIAVIMFATDWVSGAFFKDGGYKTFFGTTNGWLKLAVLAVFAVAFAISCIFLYFMNKRFEARNQSVLSPYQIGFIAVVSEFIFMVIGKSFAFYFWYSFLSSGTWSSFFFWGPFAVLVIAMPVNILLITLVNCLLLPVAQKVISPRRGVSNGK